MAMTGFLIPNLACGEASSLCLIVDGMRGHTAALSQSAGMRVAEEVSEVSAPAIRVTLPRDRFPPARIAASPVWNLTDELMSRLSRLTRRDLHVSDEAGTQWLFPPAQLLLGAAYYLHGEGSLKMRPMSQKAEIREMEAMAEARERPLLTSYASLRNTVVHGVRDLPPYVAWLHDLYHLLVLNLFDDETRGVFLLLHRLAARLPDKLDLIKPLLSEAFLDGPNLRPEDLPPEGFDFSRTYPLVFATVGSYLTDLLNSYTGLSLSKGERHALVQDFVDEFLPVLESQFQDRPGGDEVIAGFRGVFQNYLPS